MQKKCRMIVAMARNRGIGNKNELPWRLRNESRHFARLTTTTKDKDKKNVILMGRRTWQSIPEKHRPLQNRINMVISTKLKQEDLPEGVQLVETVQEALELMEKSPWQDLVETVWIGGGEILYKEFMSHPQCDRIYLTQIDAEFECDAFFPEVGSDFEEIRDPDIPYNVQEEDGCRYTYHVYQRK